MKSIRNSYGVEIDFEVAVNLMDDELRELVAWNCSPCSNEEFFDAYASAHFAKFNGIWELDTAHPQF